MERHICQRCGHLWGEHGSKACLAFGCCCGRSRLDADKHNNQDVNARIAALEAELAAEREAVRVLADEVRECFVIFGRMKPSDMMDHLHPKTQANPIASAAITDAAKAREGA